MQNADWDSFRYLIALYRAGSPGAAARQLGVNATTVSRRIKTLQTQLKTQIITQSGRGQISFTAAGESLVTRAEAMERHVERALTDIMGVDELAAGSVVVTATPALANRLIVPRLSDLLGHYPGLNIEIKPDTRNLSLVRREADIALRLGRPLDGGNQVKVRRIGSLRYGVYASRNYSDQTANGLAWVTYRDELADLPQQHWMTKQISQSTGNTAPIKVGDAEGVIEAIASAPYRSILPRLIGDSDPRLSLLEADHCAPMLERELWLMTRADMAKLARIKVTGDWLVDIFNGD